MEGTIIDVREFPEFAAGHIGSGLVFAGVRNTRMMASFLGRVPRNKVGA